jgi:hypothetical protein
VAPQGDRLSTALAAVSALAQGQGLGVGQLDLNGTPATAWTRLSLPQGRGGDPLRVITEVAGLQAQVNDYTVLAASAALLDRVAHPPTELWQPPTWWPAAAVPSTGYIHLDWPRLEAIVAQQLSQGWPRWRLWETAAQPILKHLRQIALVGGDRSEAMQIGRIQIQLSNQ